MKILLINQNATVEKLVRLSAAKVGLEVQAIANTAAVSAGEYAWVLIDHEAMGGADLAALRAQCPGAKMGLLHPKNGERTGGFDLYIEKPFLPTELIDEFSAQMGQSQDEAADESLDMELPSLDEGESDLGADLGDLSLDDTFGDSSAGLAGMDDLDLGGDEGHDALGSLDGLDDELTLDSADSATMTASGDDLGDSMASDGLEDLSLDLDSLEADEAPATVLGELPEEAAGQPEEFNLEDVEIEADELPATDGGELDDLDADMTAPGEEEPKISILDKEEVEKVKELLNEDSLEEDAAAPMDDLSLEGEDFPDLTESLDDLEAPEAEASSDMKLELGENSALLDEDDLADLHKSGGDLDDEALLDDSFGEMEEMQGEELETLEDSFAQEEAAMEEPLPAFDFNEQSEAGALGSDEELGSLSEESVAVALGEELPQKPQPAASVQAAPAAQASGVAASSLEGALATLSTGTLRELLDGMQLTINISFPNKKS
ncbi:MAG: hypothetical protein AB7E49_09085 [Campylobacterales bacterium]